MLYFREEILNKWIIANGYNKSTFCKLCGISYQTLANIYKNKKMTPKSARIISEHTNLDIKEFSFIKE